MFRKIFYLSLVTFLFACATSSNHEAYVSSSEEELPYPDSVASYQSEAELTLDEELKNSALLKETGRLIQDGMIERAEQKLQDLNELSPLLNNEKNMQLAQLFLLKKESTNALRSASKVSELEQMPLRLQKFYHQLLANIYHLRNKNINEAEQLIALDELQKSTTAKLETRRSIWQALSMLPLTKEKAINLEAQGELAGWLSLNILAKEHRDSASTLVKAINNWQQKHPEHPGNDIVKAEQVTFTPAPKKMAVLLPLSGNLSGPGEAIRDGFMDAYFKSKSKGATVRFYDTNIKNAADQYKLALANGAQLVIGPLTKANVEKVANGSVGVPTIALNDIDKAGPDNLYRFSIDPQNEARQLAFKVNRDGYRRALVIAPKGHWGESIAQAFSTSWLNQGKEVAKTFYFDAKTDVNSAVRQWLDVSVSHDRYNDLVRTIWKRPKFYARRRQDFDVIILLSHASMARQLRPMLKYYYAGDVPIYGTSLIYSGSPKPGMDMDLNGIIFGEMPYLLNAKKSLIAKSWPEQFNSYNRLYAMGQDAYLLSHQLNQLKLFPMMGALDNTGTLFMDKQRQIVRQLDWAQFKQGVVKPA